MPTLKLSFNVVNSKCDIHVSLKICGYNNKWGNFQTGIDVINKRSTVSAARVVVWDMSLIYNH